MRLLGLGQACGVTGAVCAVLADPVLSLLRGPASLQDVSEQIEDEEQVLGLQGDQPEDPPEDNGPEEEDNGIEMSGDFDAELYDVPPPPEEEGDDKEGDDKEEKEDLDEQVGRA